MQFYNYSTYIFDLDGTLLDTLTDLMASTNHALAQHHMPLRTFEETRKFVGNGVKKLIERAVPEATSKDEFDKVFATFKQHYGEHSLDHTKPYPGVLDLLANLHANGKKMAIVSNKYYDATRELCQHFFGDYISVAIGERADIKMKPAPDTVILALEQLGSTVQEAVYIGDSEVDIATARNAKMPCISVLWGFRNRDFLAEQGGTTFVSTPQELML